MPAPCLPLTSLIGCLAMPPGMHPCHPWRSCAHACTSCLHAHAAMGLTPEHVDRMGDHLRVVLSDLGINNFEVERILHSLSSMRWVFAISDK